jgi:hypothetical protein
MNSDIIKDIINIKNTIFKYNEYLLEYGFNENYDGKILSDIKSFDEKLAELEKKLNYEKGDTERNQKD